MTREAEMMNWKESNTEPIFRLYVQNFRVITQPHTYLKTTGRILLSHDETDFF